MQKCLQPKWLYLQRSLGCIGDLFDPIEDAIINHYLPTLFGIPAAAVTPEVYKLMALPIKQAGLGLRNPKSTATHNFVTSSDCTNILTTVLVRGTPLNLLNHHKTMDVERKLNRAARYTQDEMIFESLTNLMTEMQNRIIEQSKSTGAWLSILPIFINGCDLSIEEFQDGVRMRYGITLDDLPRKGDGCGAKLNLEYALQCKKGDNVVLGHNDVRDELAFLATQATNP